MIENLLSLTNCKKRI